MKTSTLLITTVLAISFGGCASVPPPKITDTTYENYKYEFGVEIPEGWVHTNLSETKKLFGINSTLFGPDIIAIFNDPSKDTNLTILAANRTIYGLDVLSIIGREEMTQTYSDQKQQIENLLRADFPDVTCKQVVHSTRLRKGPPIHAYDILCHYQYEDKQQDLLAQDYYYTCQEDDTCTIRFVSTAQHDVFEDITQGVRDIAKSISHVAPPEAEQ